MVYFWDPELQRYCAIPYRNTTHPSISIWELRELRRRLRESGSSPMDEDAVFEVYARLREREARAVTETKRIRRARARRRSLPASVALQPSAPSETEPLEPTSPAPSRDNIEPYEIEELS